MGDTGYWSGGIGAGFTAIGTHVIEVIHPLRDIATHIVKAFAIRFKATYDC
jgi:uncharacterized protein YwlG (UPF0340 family)